MLKGVISCYAGRRVSARVWRGGSVVFSGYVCGIGGMKAGATATCVLIIGSGILIDT